MANSIPQPAPFATARCPHCACQRPAYDRLDANGEVQQACLVCDRSLLITDYCTLDELGGLGFGIVEEAPISGGCGCSGGGCSHKLKLN